MDPLADLSGLVDPAAAIPPFEQLRTGLAARVTDGRLPAGTRLPTVRGLAEQLGLAPGTVARAYKELEADGVLVTEGRRGTFVRDTAPPAADVAALAAELVAAARRAGLTLAEATRTLERAWPPR